MVISNICFERLHQCMVYKAEVPTNTTYQEYYGASEGEFKSRYNNHTQSFRFISHIIDAELSKYLWTLKANRTDYHLNLSIKSYVHPDINVAQEGVICVWQKKWLLFWPKVLLNKRTELTSKCRHRSNFILNRVK